MYNRVRDPALFLRGCVDQTELVDPQLPTVGLPSAKRIIHELSW